jgi:glycopeptide antibiotics resistance protein
MNRSRSSLVFILCAIYSLIAGLYPFEFSDRTSSFDLEFPWGFLKAVLVPIKNVGLSDFLQNIAYFVPWGAIYYIFTASPNRRPRTLVLSAALVGAIVSIAIEICQIFFSRYPSVFDVLANTLGAGMGALLCAFSPIDVRRIVARSLARAEQSQLLLPAALLLGILPLLISVSKFPWTDFHNWDRGFTLQIANEASLDRPWLGRIYLVAIYDRALAPEEIARNYRLGASNEAIGSRVSRGLIALYTFTEGHGAEVSDVSGYRRPLDLTLSPSSHFRWLGHGNGLEVIQPAVLTSGRPAEKLYDALNTSSELSVEVWMTPANVEQKGPARIVSLSRNPVARNFTVGQDGADIDFRLRTPVSGTNGTTVNLRTRNGFLAPEQFHVVATYRGGVEKLFVNGREHPDKVDLRKPDIIIAFGTKNNPVAQMAYSFFYFFPVSFFFSWTLSRRSAGCRAILLLPAVLAVSLLSVAEVFQAYVFARPIDLVLLSCGAVVGMFGALCGASFAKGPPSLPRDFLSFT